MRVAVVTGSSKGIGLFAVKQLAQKFDGGVVYLTARNEQKGLQAVEDLKKEGVHVKFAQLDITNVQSCVKFRDQFASLGIDILINNAAIAFKKDSTHPFGIQAEVTMKTNYYGTKQFCDVVFPLLKKDARVVNVSSVAGLLCKINGKEPEAAQLRATLSDPNITMDKLDELAKDFAMGAKNGTHFEAGWPNSAYSVSKVLVSVLTRIQQRVLDIERPNDNILVNSVHPGWVMTDMTGHQGNFPPERGAQALVWGALIPQDKREPRGGFIWHDNSLVEFTIPNSPSNW